MGTLRKLAEKRRAQKPQPSQQETMTAEQIRKSKDKTPFAPFTIHLSDQRHFQVPHPEFVWVIPGGKTIGVSDKNGAVEIVDLLHVTSVQLTDSSID